MSWGARRGDCADMSLVCGILVPLLGAPQTLWSWGGRILAGIIPATPHPSTARPPHPAQPRRGTLGGVWAGGVFCAGGPRAGGAPRFRAGFTEQAGFQLGPSQNQPIRYSPDLRLDFTAPLCKGEDAQSRSSCPPQPVSRQNRLRSCGVGALVGEQRVGLHRFSQGRRFPAPEGQAAPRKASWWRHRIPVGILRSQTPAQRGGKERAGNAQAGTRGG